MVYGLIFPSIHSLGHSEPFYMWIHLPKHSPGTATPTPFNDSPVWTESTPIGLISWLKILDALHHPIFQKLSPTSHSYGPYSLAKSDYLFFQVDLVLQENYLFIYLNPFFCSYGKAWPSNICFSFNHSSKAGNKGNLFYKMFFDSAHSCILYSSLQPKLPDLANKNMTQLNLNFRSTIMLVYLPRNIWNMLMLEISLSEI